MKRFFAALVAVNSIACGAPTSENPPAEGTPAVAPVAENTPDSGPGGTEVVERWRGKARDCGFRGTCHEGGRSRLRSVPERIATFDNDGTLWAEKPVPFQLLFAFDRVKAWRRTIRSGRQAAVLVVARRATWPASRRRGTWLLQIMQRHARRDDHRGVHGAVQNWITTARHPQYQTALHRDGVPAHAGLLDYLRANGFKTFIVSGGGVEFMRPWAERVYGIPPEQVVGSGGKLKFEMRDGRPVLVKLAEST